MNNADTKFGTPITFCDGLSLLFIAAKLFKVISWPWWVVLSPIWVQLTALVIAITTNTIIRKRK